MKTAIRTDTAIRNDGALLESQELTKYTLEVMSLENDVAFTALLRASFMILHKMFPKSPKARMAAMAIAISSASITLETNLKPDEGI